MSFISEVRKSRVKHPTQKGHDVEYWKANYKKFSSNSTEDENLFQFGLWASDNLTKIRALFDDLEAPAIKGQKLKQLFCAFVNRSYAVTQESIVFDKNENNKTIFAGDLIKKKLPIGPNGEPIDSEALIESLVSAIRFGLVRADQTSNKLKNLSDLTNVMPLDGYVLFFLNQISKLSIMYDDYVHYWHECLWNGWTLEVSDKYNTIKFPRTNRFFSHVISQYRDKSLLLEYSLHAMKYLEQNKNRLRDESVVGLKLKLGAMHLVVGQSKDEFPPISKVAEIVAEKFYWDELLEEPLPNIKNLTIRKLLSVYRVINSLAFLLKKTFPTSTEVTSISNLRRFSPKIKKHVLRQALKKATGLSSDMIDKAISILTFQDKLSDELWFKPIVPVGDNEFVFLTPVLEIANLVRTIEYWMKMGGLDLDRRGGIYEKFIVDRIENSTKNSKVFKDSIIDFGVFDFGGVKEEIDLVLVFKNVILIGEVKCSVTPATPIEINNYFSILEGAVGQVERKANFVRTYLDKFISKYKNRNEFDASKNIKVIPIVISNLHLGAGIPINNIPIVDHYILEHYFKGNQKFLNINDKKLSLNSYYKENYYSNENEAENNIENYLINPPYLNYLSKNIKFEVEPIGFVGNGQKLTLVEKAFVEIQIQK